MGCLTRKPTLTAAEPRTLHSRRRSLLGPPATGGPGPGWGVLAGDAQVRSAVCPHRSPSFWVPRVLSSYENTGR